MHLSTVLTTGILKTTNDYIEALQKMNIHTAQDLLLYLPRSHEDLSQMDTIGSAPLDEKVTIRGVVEDVKLVYTKRGKRLVTATFTDSNGESVGVVWYNQPHIKRMLKDGAEVVLTGKLAEMGYKLVFQSPQIEMAGKGPLLHAGRLVPIYPQHDVITTRWLRQKMPLVASAIDEFKETLPPEVVGEEKLMPRKDGIRALHFPENPEQIAAARARMTFEHAYALQHEALERRRDWQSAVQARLKTPMDIDLIRALFASLKFTPTGSQKVAIYEILKDMESATPMSRLLEGDVGSGKTLVAVAVMANVIRSDAQCALMVPTEVLARQHAEGIMKLLLNFRHFLEQTNEYPNLKTFQLPAVALLTGSTPRPDSDRIKLGVASGTVDVVVGTHALIEEDVRFKDLRLVIVDEQHRFGVRQRQRLKEKGSPHFLSMTATPIPRTLALTAYGEHDLSVLLEKPGRRQPISTRVVGPKERRTVEGFIDHQIGEGRQAFVICPLITESEQLAEVKNVEAEAKRLRAEFTHRRVALLHGKLSPQEKQQVMQEFREGKSDILVSTSVIEVGIDVPNATIIIIEGAERFGLAQLHQLRGRVGRGDHKSHCFLFATTQEQANSPRLKAMEQHESGFLLAEIDLKLRGPGELYGLRQSGMPDIDAGDLLNPELITRARKAASRSLGLAEAGSYDRPV